MIDKGKNMMELGCEWHFDKQGGADKGPTDANRENFNKNEYASLIRESIQNSLDAVHDKDVPVRVEYQFKKIAKRDFPSFFDLIRHVEACKDYYHSNSRAVNLFTKMANSLRAPKLRYIKISDYNTIGMNYEGSNDVDSSFYSFVRSTGVSNKDGQTGGSFGLGKGAYINVSSLHTFLVSTMTRDKSYCFEGVSNLTTHRYSSKRSLFDGEKKAAEGFYDNNQGEPITNPLNIPKCFRRSQPGTDIIIMGYGNENDFKRDEEREIETVQKEMIEAVLRSFWVAIIERKLIVLIGDHEISSDTLAYFMQDYFQEIKDNTSRNNPIYNPRPYYEAYMGVKKKSANNCKLFTEEIEGLGKCYLYLKAKTNEPKLKILKMRTPRMLIFKDHYSNYEGYGVFVCDGDVGNQFLRSLENPSHDSWIKPRASVDRKLHKKAKTILNAIDYFIEQSIKEFYPENNSSIIQVEGLDDYLSINDSLLDESEDMTLSKLRSIGQAKVSKKKSKKETGASRIKLSKRKIAEIKMDDVTPNDTNALGELNETVNTSKIGEEEILVDSKNHEGDSPINHSGVGNLPRNVALQSEGKETVRKKIYLNLRVVAQHYKDKYKHVLLIYADKTYRNCEILISGVGDDGGSNLEIKESSLGAYNGGCISNLSLNRGKNRIDVEFADDLVHSLKIEAYEIK